MTELKQLLARKEAKRQKQRKLPYQTAEVKLELYEYLIKVLLHYKSFRSSKDGNTYYFFTLLPEEVPPHTRMHTTLHQFVILREKNIFSENLRKQRIKRHRLRLRYEKSLDSNTRSKLQSLRNLDTSILSYDDEESYVNRTQIPSHSALMDTFLHDLTSLPTPALSQTQNLQKVAEENQQAEEASFIKEQDQSENMESSNNKLIEALSKIPLGEILDHLGTENDFDAQFKDEKERIVSPKYNQASLESSLSEIGENEVSQDEKKILSQIDTLYAKLRQSRGVKKPDRRVTFRRQDEIIEMDEPVPLARLNVLREDLEEQMDKSSEISESDFEDSFSYAESPAKQGRIIDIPIRQAERPPSNNTSAQLEDEVRNMQLELRNLMKSVTKEKQVSPKNTTNRHHQANIQEVRMDIMRKNEAKSSSDLKSELLTATEQIRQLQALKERIDKQLSKSTLDDSQMSIPTSAIEEQQDQSYVEQQSVDYSNYGEEEEVEETYETKRRVVYEHTNDQVEEEQYDEEESIEEEEEVYENIRNQERALNRMNASWQQEEEEQSIPSRSSPPRTDRSLQSDNDSELDFGSGLYYEPVRSKTKIQTITSDVVEIPKLKFEFLNE
jgi:hypothetical protein